MYICLLKHISKIILKLFDTTYKLFNISKKKNLIFYIDCVTFEYVYLSINTNCNMTKKIQNIWRNSYITKILCETSMRAKIIYKDCNMLQHAIGFANIFSKKIWNVFYLISWNMSHMILFSAKINRYYLLP